MPVRTPCHFPLKLARAARNEVATSVKKNVSFDRSVATDYQCDRSTLASVFLITVAMKSIMRVSHSLLIFLII